MKYIVGLGICLSLVSWSASVSLADPPGNCSNRTVKGKYGTVFTGFINTGGPTLSSNVPLASVGLWTIDGAGNLSGSDFVSVNGMQGPRMLTGTYTVNPDCTTTGALNEPGGGTGVAHGVVLDNGDTIILISAIPGFTVTGRLTRLPNSSGNRDD